MQPQEYLDSLREELNQLNQEIDRLEELSQQKSSQWDDNTKGQAKGILSSARKVFDEAKSKVEEYNLKRELALDEAKGGLDMARKDLQETFKSIKSLLQ